MTIPSPKRIRAIARRAALAAHHDTRRRGGTIPEAQAAARYAAKRAVAGLTRAARQAHLRDARRGLELWRDRHGYTRGGRHVPPKPYTSGLNPPRHRWRD